ncbi:unnamed protein product [Ectocarpus sp. CCAP 1310/34]|nr:unnamed protein product [Ectocarpus sp. CCAP 1310/34]
MLEGCRSIALMLRLCAAISIASVLAAPPPRARPHEQQNVKAVKMWRGRVVNGNVLESDGCWLTLVSRSTSDKRIRPQRPPRHHRSVAV